jgi:hypothetical protein
MPGFQPGEGRAGIMEDCGYVRKTVQGGEEGPPANLIRFLERGFFGTLREMIVCTDDATALLHGPAISSSLEYGRDYSVGFGVQEVASRFF